MELGSKAVRGGRFSSKLGLPEEANWISKLVLLKNDKNLSFAQKRQFSEATSGVMGHLWHLSCNPELYSNP